MKPTDRLFDASTAFDHPVTVGIVIGVGALLVLSPLVIAVLARLGKISPALHDELRRRCLSWAVIAPAICIPVLLGAGWVVAAVAAISLLCFREYARATGLFRDRVACVVVVVGILAIAFAALDAWYGFFVALWPLGTILIAATGLLGDRPKGYIQRTGLALFGFALFGAGLGHLAYFANDSLYRPILLWLVTGVALNDVFAFVVGKSVGGPKLCPATSPNKTVSGAVGALVLTTALVAALAGPVFAGTPVGSLGHRLALGVIVSAGGQMGDLMLSSIKRDVGIKDMGAAIPGHGGFLDRFNSLLLVAPAVFHYVGYVNPGIGLDLPERILSGEW